MSDEQRVALKVAGLKFLLAGVVIGLVAWYAGVRLIRR